MKVEAAKKKYISFQATREDVADEKFVSKLCE